MFWIATQGHWPMPCCCKSRCQLRCGFVWEYWILENRVPPIPLVYPIIIPMQWSIAGYPSVSDTAIWAGQPLGPKFGTHAGDSQNLGLWDQHLGRFLRDFKQWALAKVGAPADVPSPNFPPWCSRFEAGSSHEIWHENKHRPRNLSTGLRARPG